MGAGEGDVAVGAEEEEGEAGDVGAGEGLGVGGVGGDGECADEVGEVAGEGDWVGGARGEAAGSLKMRRVKRVSSSCAKRSSRRASWLASIRPVGPAPTMRTSRSVWGSVWGVRGAVPEGELWLRQPRREWVVAAGARGDREMGMARSKAGARGRVSAGGEPAEAQAEAVVAELKRLGSKRMRDEMGPRYGVHTDKAFGVSMSAMQALAKRLGRSHDLAEALWETGWYEARMVAAFVEAPERVTAAQMDRWSKDFDNWGICDTVCFHLFDRTPHAFRKVEQWSGRRDEFVKRAAFALLACLALHRKDADEAWFARCLPLVERAATDDRNFVKKGVSWALRAIGRRGGELHSGAMEVAERLAGSSDAAARWVGKDALRDLSKQKAAGGPKKKRPMKKKSKKQAAGSRRSAVGG